MKINKIFDSIEVSILSVGILIIIGLFVLGFLKQGIDDKPTYVSNRKEDSVETQESQNGTSDTLALKQEVFEVKQNAQLSEKPETYFEGNATLFKDVTLDVSAVDMETVSTYPVSATYQSTTYTFQIKVVESKNPSFVYDRKEFKYLVGDYSTIEEVKEMANVVAYDQNGNDISETITGWPTSLPTTLQPQTYILSAKDTSGNVGYLTLHVDYQRVEH